MTIRILYKLNNFFLEFGLGFGLIYVCRIGKFIPSFKKLKVKICRGENLVEKTKQRFNYPSFSLEYFIHFTWPYRTISYKCVITVHAFQINIDTVKMRVKLSMLYIRTKYKH